MDEALLDWEKRYQNEDTPWDKGAPAPALGEVFQGGYFPKGGEVLVPGCGYGHDAREIAAAGYAATGMDISEAAVAGARLAAGNEGAMFIQGDLFDPALAGSKRYGAIWEHTCFCAILPEQRDDYVEAAHRLLKPGGVLVGLFFAFGDDEEGPPFKSDKATLHRHFEKHFTLEWERRPERFFPTREGIELLMCWRRSE